MDEAGYGVTLDDGAKGVVAVEVRNCVYRELAEEYPDIVCPFDRGTVCGMLGVDAVRAHPDALHERRRRVLPARVPAVAGRPAQPRRPLFGAAPPAAVSLSSPASPVP